MALAMDMVGKRYPPVGYAIGREKIREYAQAVGETNPLYLDLEVARKAGYADLVAPPMFAVVYAGRAVFPVLFDPELGIDFAMLVHGAQSFRWERLLVAGDEVGTEVEVVEVRERRGLGYYVFESRSCDRQGEPVCTGRWTNIVRGVEE